MLKILVVCAFLLIIISLGTALFHLVRPKDEAHSLKTAKALTVRISLSLLLFLGVFLAYLFGYIQPHGIGLKIQQHQNVSDR